MKNLKKTYKVRNHKKTEHIYTLCGDVSEYLDVLATHDSSTMFVWKEKGERREITYLDFVEAVRALGLGLEEIFGASNGEHPVRIAVIGESSPKWFASYLAVMAAGYTVVPMDKELAVSEIGGFLKFAGITGAVYSASFAAAFEEMAPTHETLDVLIPMSDPESDAPEGVRRISFNSLCALGRSTGREFEPDDDRERVAELLFTSGTTGSSKCVMLCQRNIFAAMGAACESVDFRSDDVLVSVLPLHHTYELTCTWLAGLNFGLTICINDSLRNVLKSFREYQPTGLVLVPLFITTMYKKILTEAKKSGKDKILQGAIKAAHAMSMMGVDMSDKLFGDVREAFGGRLEKIVCGGAALNPELIEIFETFGISIYEGYGITECAPLVAVTPYYKRKPGSVGPAVPCCEVRIDGTEADEDGHVTGEIQVRGDNVMLGYMNNEEANEGAYTEDGWYRTGDVGFMDPDGYITITGRMKSVIVLDNGKNVFPEEIEEYLEDIDLIAESVVVGREEEDGTHLVAVIFPNYAKYTALQENEFRTEIQKRITALNKRLPSFKQIHKLEFRKTEFEKTTTKKIKRHLVK
ncbi:MAG: AMP-binding protein [Clostridiales bacterium]|nr:AMP-binding protein [Clostridiales bacterium]